MAGEINERQGKRGKSYYVRIELPPGPDGERNQVTITGKKYKDLERKQRDLLHQIDEGKYSVAPAKMTLGEFLDFYLDEINRRNIRTIVRCDQNVIKFFKAPVPQGSWSVQQSW